MIDLQYTTTQDINYWDFLQNWSDFIKVSTTENIDTNDIVISIQPSDSSYQYSALMQSKQLILKFSLPFHIEIPVGATCVFSEQRYYIKRPIDIKKQSTNNFEYSAIMYADDERLSDYKMRNTVDGRLKWSICARPHEFIEAIVNNLNIREGKDKWKVGQCVECSEKTIEFNHTDLLSALNEVATTFETEWEITQDCTINLQKVEYFKDEPLPLSYGRGNGFVPGLGRSSQTDGDPIKRLYVQGGERNIDRSVYGDLFGLSNKPAELRLPKSQTIEIDGRVYKSDPDGYYIERADKIIEATKEDSIDCSEIYPSFIGSVTKLEAIDAKKNLYDFIDSTIPEDLDFNKYLIAGESMTLIFQNGMLAGKEFEVKYKHDERRWQLVPIEENGFTFPNETFKPNDNADAPDTYAVFGIMLPKEYICNDESKSGAAWDMMREAARKLYESEDQKFTFTGEIQGKWAKHNWESVGSRLIVGGYVLFSDNQFAKEGMPIRIVGVKNYINTPYAPTIELSNSISSPKSVSNSLKKIENTEVVIEDTKRDIMRFTKRRFRDALDTIKMLEDSQLDFDSSISPISVKTMAMLVGDESLQFIVSRSLTTFGSSNWSIQYEDGVLKAPFAYLRHMTLGISSITGTRSVTDYMTWRMNTLSLTPKDNVKYYLYAVVPRGEFKINDSKTALICNKNGKWELSETSHAIDEDPSVYYLLAGVLNSEYDGTRSFASLYGFTEILPGRMTTDLIVSNDGKTYMNLATGEICGNIKFLSEDDEYVTIIDGGKIKSEFIDISTLIANHIIAGDPDGERVEITPQTKAVEVYNDKNELCTILEGKNYNSLSELFNDSNGNVEMKHRDSASFGCEAGVRLSRGLLRHDSESFSSRVQQGTIALSEAFKTCTPTEVKTIQGTLIFECFAKGFTQDKSQIYENQRSSWSGGTVNLEIKTYSDETQNELISTKTISSCNLMIKAQEHTTDSVGNLIYHDNSVNRTIDFTNLKVIVPKGYNVVVLTYATTMCAIGSYCNITWGNMNALHDDLMFEYSNEYYVSRYFSNGFCLGNRISNYISALFKDAMMQFAVETNGVGFSVSNRGIETKLSGYNWMPTPQMIYRAFVNYDAASQKYVVKKEQCFDTDKPIIQRVSTGAVSITLPDHWNNYIKSYSFDNLMVRVSNVSSGNRQSSVEYFASQNYRVRLYENNVLKDANFSIEIFHIQT